MHLISDRPHFVSKAESDSGGELLSDLIAEDAGRGVDAEDAFDAVDNRVSESADFLLEPVNSGFDTIPDSGDKLPSDIFNAVERVGYCADELVDDISGGFLDFVQRLGEPFDKFLHGVESVFRQFRQSLEKYVNQLSDKLPCRGGNVHEHFRQLRD